MKRHAHISSLRGLRNVQPMVRAQMLGVFYLCGRAEEKCGEQISVMATSDVHVFSARPAGFIGQAHFHFFFQSQPQEDPFSNIYKSVPQSRLSTKCHI